MLRSSEIPNFHRRITCSWTFRLILHTEVCMDISSPFKPQVLSSTAVSLSLGLVVSHYHVGQKIASSIPHIYHLTGKPKQPDLGLSSSLKWPMCRLDHVFLDLDLGSAPRGSCNCKRPKASIAHAVDQRSLYGAQPEVLL